jgi:alkaline phosphatase D
MSRITRRDLLLGGTAALLVPACRGGVLLHEDSDVGDSGDTGRVDTDDTGAPDTGWTWEPGPEPTSAWSPDGAVDAAAFPSGVQVGDALPTAAIAMAQTTAELVSARLARATADGWEEGVGIAAIAVIDGSARVELPGLIPDTTYAVCFVGGSGRSAVTRFRTAAYAGRSRVIRFGATSCLNDDHAPWPCLDSAAADELDFFVLLGDTIYADGGAGDVPWFTSFYRVALATSGLLGLTASTSVIATWDDHELDNDWSGPQDGADRQAAALVAFRAAIPQRDGPSGGLWRVLSWGDTLDVIVLDCRGERTSNQYISLEQMVWLKTTLSASRARFKIIVNSVPITDWTGTVLAGFIAGDRWQGYPVDREEVLAHIADNGITGVLWITGDHHFAAVTHVDPAGGVAEDAVEVLCGPAGSGINGAAWGIPVGERFPIVVHTYNWTRFTADPDAGTVKVEFVGDDGDELDSITLNL